MMTKKKRTFRNTIMIVMIVLLAFGTYFTFDAAKDSAAAFPSTSFQGGPPSMDSSGGDSSNQPPAMPDGNSSDGSTDSQPPAPPSGDSTGDSSNNQPPEMPSGNNSNNSSDNSSNSQPPEKPDDSTDSSTDTQSTDSSDSQMPSPPSDGNGMKNGGRHQSVSTWYYVALALESAGMAAIALYLIMSHMNKRGVRETFKNGRRVLIFALATAIIAGGLTFAETSAIGTNDTAQGMHEMGEMPGSSSESVDAAGATTVDGSEETLDGTYTSTASDESPILVTNGGNATITGTVNKESGDSSNTENSEFYGVNAGVLVQADSTATIDGATISTSAKGANAVFSTGENSKVYVKNTTITTTGSSSSRGLDATYGGYIEADNVTITTKGGSCAALATDRGEGTVIANHSTLTTNGAGSPVIYSTGDISIDSTKGTANGAQMVVIEGKNSATVTNSTLTASGAGNRGDVDIAGIMIYQSMSGDAGEGTGTFTAKNSTLSVDKNSAYYKSAPMFFITNTDVVINLTDTKLSFGSGTIISAMGTSEWGNSGSNGGNVTLNATGQTLVGNIEVDKISTASLNLTKSTYKGTINGDNTAKEIALKLDKDSTITLTGDSYVTSLENADTTNSNINFNGYTLYVNGTAVN